MAKTSMVERELKREKLVKRHAKKRAELKAVLAEKDEVEMEWLELAEG